VTFKVPVAILFKCDSRYSYAAVDKISTDTERRACAIPRHS